MTTVTTHVLDTARGEPGAGMKVHLSRRVDDGWERIGDKATDGDGRADFGQVDSGRYRLGFETGDYGNLFLPYVHVVFEVDATRPRHHVPLLLSPFGYSTYRGS